MGVVFTALIRGRRPAARTIGHVRSVHLDVGACALRQSGEPDLALGGRLALARRPPRRLAGLPPELPRMDGGRRREIALLTALFWQSPQALDLRRGLRRHARPPDGSDLAGGASSWPPAAAAVAGLRRGGLDHRHRDVHLPTRRRPADDEPPRDTGRLERLPSRLLSAVAGTILAGLRPALARRRERGSARPG